MDNTVPTTPPPSITPPITPTPPPPLMPTPTKPSIELKNSSNNGNKSHMGLMAVVAIVVVLVILIGGAFWYLNSNQTPSTPPTVVTAQPTSSPTPPDNLNDDVNNINVAPVDTATMDADLQKLQ